MRERRRGGADASERFLCGVGGFESRARRVLSVLKSSPPLPRLSRLHVHTTSRANVKEMYKNKQTKNDRSVQKLPDIPLETFAVAALSRCRSVFVVKTSTVGVPALQ